MLAGLQNCRQHKKSEAVLLTRDADNQPLCHGGEKVTAELRYRDVSRRQLPVNILDRKDGSYLVWFVPDTSGNLSLSVSVNGHFVKGSPFHVCVRTLRPHHGTFHCCSFCSSGGSKEATCGCGGSMPGTVTCVVERTEGIQGEATRAVVTATRGTQGAGTGRAVGIFWKTQSVVAATRVSTSSHSNSQPRGLCPYIRHPWMFPIYICGTAEDGEIEVRISVGRQLLKCAACGYVQYCNRECQKQSWEDHKAECGNLRRVAPRVVPDAARLLARIIFKLKRGGDLERRYYTETKSRTFKDLMSHYSNVKQDKLKMEHLTALSVVLTEFIGESNMPNSAELLAMYGRGTTIFIRALRDIPALDWDKVTLGYHSKTMEIFISYIDLLNFPQERHKELQQTYYFLCECRRCNDVEELAGMSSVVCPNQVCREPVPVPTQKQNGIFHKQDMLRARVVDLAFESSIEMGQFLLAREYGEELVSSYRKYYGPTHPLLGLLHLKLAKLLLYLEESQEAVTHARLAQKVLKVTHGENHSLYQGELAAVIQQCHSHKLFQPNP
uniref:MYND-type domain-containing protein n=1 Tax=Timema tahoe TaxID=61484 RepID=A0A7R9NZV8_9NEOP|nr:unnamed protein product [Timema tahoe]